MIIIIIITAPSSSDVYRQRCGTKQHMHSHVCRTIISVQFVVLWCSSYDMAHCV